MEREVQLFSPASSTTRAHEAVDCVPRSSLLSPIPAVMEDENDFQEAFTDLDGILPDRSHTTLNVLGGIGGQGGRGGQDGGAGGNGEGPTFNFSRAEGWIVHVNDGNALKNPRDFASAVNSAPHAVALCDINLQEEVYLDGLRVNPSPRRSQWRKVVRRYYTAEIKDRREMTAVFYEGQDAKEELKRDVAKYMKVRHPSLLQLYGTVDSEYIHASIFYEAMVPLKNIDSIYRQSPMLPCYVHAYAAHEFSVGELICTLFSGLFICQQAAANHLFSIFGILLGSLGDYTLFLRPSTGRLCIDLQGNEGYLSLPVPGTEHVTPHCLLSTIDSQIIIDALTLKQYHEICDTAFIHRKYIHLPPTTIVRLGAVYHTTGHHDLSSPIAIAPTLDPDIDTLGWQISGSIIWATAHFTTGNGWDRFHISELVHPLDQERFQRLACYFRTNPSTARNAWLSQANQIFNCLGVFSDLENYALSYDINFTIRLQHQSPMPTGRLLNGFLFLCPPQTFQIGLACLKCPECVAYWSLSPLGLDRLTTEQATELGFPTIDILISGWGRKWSNAVYAGLRQFHRGKGFDPDSQDVARHLGYPLYEVYSEHEKSLNTDGSEAWVEELSSSDTEHLVDEDELGNLETENEKFEIVSKNGGAPDEDSENIVVSGCLNSLALIQLSLMLFLAILGACGSS